MRSLVVLFAVVSAACGSLVPLAQPAHHPALVLDAHGRPLDTAEVINARALHLQAKALEHGHYTPLLHHAAPLVHAAPAVHAVLAPAAVSHQARVDVHTSHAAPVWGAHALSAPVWGAHAAYGHYLHKRSLGHLAYAAPLHYAPAAVSHQSRVDVISSPAVVAHAVAAPVLAHHAVAAPLVAHAAPVSYVGGSAVSHQSRVDVRTSPAVVSHSVVAPVVSHAVLAAPVVSAHSAWGFPAYGAHDVSLSHGHLLRKRSLTFAHVLPAAVSHQSRVDVISSHAAPIAVAHAAPVSIAHAVPAAAVSHQSRVDVISSGAHAAPLAHSALWTAPAYWAHSGLLHSSPLAYAAHW